MTNKPKYYRNSITTETELSDFHKMTTTVLKTYVKKQSPELFIESTKVTIIFCFRKNFHLNSKIYYQMTRT